MNPESRRDYLLAESVGDELVIYDEQTHQAHRLSRTAAVVWQAADGTRDVGGVAARLRESLRESLSANEAVDSIDEASSEALVRLALDELDRTGLLARGIPSLGESMSRREMIGVAAALLPVIASIVAPTPAMAQTVQPALCTYTVTGPTSPISGNGGTASIAVATTGTCASTATSMSPFITGGPFTVTGSGSAAFTVQPNSTGVSRTGIVRVTFPAGNPTPPRDVTITQDPRLGTGMIQATLRWDANTDIDLHVIEPGGAHVFYNNKVGPTAMLDVDNTVGQGPENIFVATPVAGAYQFYIVHFSGAIPTTSNITVTVAGQAPRVFQRLTTSASPTVGYNVATVNIGPPATITETTGTRASDERAGALRKPQ